jgi:hypothetical protein
MKIVAIAGSQIPSDTANSIQVMKACNALVRLGHELTLIVPGDHQSETVNLKSHYGLQTEFEIEWLRTPNRRLFTWQAIQHARKYNPDLIYSWFIQSADFSLLYKLPVVYEIHIQPTGVFGPLWHRVFASLRGRNDALDVRRERGSGRHAHRRESGERLSWSRRPTERSDRLGPEGACTKSPAHFECCCPNFRRPDSP